MNIKKVIGSAVIESMLFAGTAFDREKEAYDKGFKNGYTLGAIYGTSFIQGFLGIPHRYDGIAFSDHPGKKHTCQQGYLDGVAFARSKAKKQNSPKLNF